MDKIWYILIYPIISIIIIFYILSYWFVGIALFESLAAF